MPQEPIYSFSITLRVVKIIFDFMIKPVLLGKAGPFAKDQFIGIEGVIGQGIVQEGKTLVDFSYSPPFCLVQKFEPSNGSMSYEIPSKSFIKVWWLNLDFFLF